MNTVSARPTFSEGDVSASYFENRLSALTGHAGLCAALVASGVKPGTEVVLSCLANEQVLRAIVSIGAKPVPVDVDPGTMQICAGSVEAAVNCNTRAIVANHAFGAPCDMKSLVALARHYVVTLVEDCCGAEGATLDGVPVGTLGDVSILSCAPAPGENAYLKPVMLKTASEVLHRQAAEWLQQLGGDPASAPEQAGCSTLHRRMIGTLYTENLLGLSDLQLPHLYDGASPSWSGYVIKTQHRDPLVDWLQEHGYLACKVVPLFDSEEMIVAHCHGTNCKAYGPRAAAQALVLPVDVMMTEQDAEAICSAIATYFAPELLRGRRGPQRILYATPSPDVPRAASA